MGEWQRLFQKPGSTYAYASRAIHPAAGYLAGWVMILDYLLMPMLCVIIAALLQTNSFPAVPYAVWVLITAGAITGINLAGIEMTSRSTIVFNGVLAISIVWFVIAAARALLGGTGQGTLLSYKAVLRPPNLFACRRDVRYPDRGALISGI